MDANLLVSYEPAREFSAKQELESLLKELKEEAKFIPLRTQGLFVLKVSNGKKVIKRLGNMHKKNPKRFKLTFNYKPIDIWTTSDIRDMQRAMKKLAPKIRKDDKWCLQLNKRNYKGDSYSLVLKLTEHIDRGKVSLDNPEKIILAEMMGNRAAFSLVHQESLLSTAKKRKKWKLLVVKFVKEI